MLLQVVSLNQPLLITCYLLDFLIGQYQSRIVFINLAQRLSVSYFHHCASAILELHILGNTSGRPFVTAKLGISHLCHTCEFGTLERTANSQLNDLVICAQTVNVEEIHYWKPRSGQVVIVTLLAPKSRRNTFCAYNQSEIQLVILSLERKLPCSSPS